MCIDLHDRVIHTFTFVLQKLVKADLNTYWATDTRYGGFPDASRCKRRCIFKMSGHEDVHVTLPDGTREKRRTTLCCQAVCFISIRGVADVLRLLNTALPENMLSEVKDDGIIFILVRYFSPHPLACERDSDWRPICPGPLRLNHCLWKYAKSARFRKSMCKPDSNPNTNFLQQGHIFGYTNEKRLECFENEKFAYFGLLSPNSVVRRVPMTQEFQTDSLSMSDTWIETVTLL